MFFHFKGAFVQVNTATLQNMGTDYDASELGMKQAKMLLGFLLSFLSRIFFLHLPLLL